jgi:hypothetical protein
MLRAKVSLVAAVALGALALVPFAAAAQTSDGQTPAQESVCNGQTGAAYGLCTAFCEAMDCDSTAPAASPTACSRVLDNFVRVAGQQPPCLCPCAAGYATVQQAAASAGLPASFCEIGESESQVHFGSPAIRLNLVYYPGQAAFCTAWNNSGTPEASVSPLTPGQVAACRSIIANSGGACSQLP